ncbi:hypothetical protein [Halomarina rubra]|uniref:Uncharacterized protein n=1 Tax=Halomarina rubra TaxID=2071873 RepID=A0ABD6AXP4_9EURY|nr:hypothetical protein [Halomarina rubra]
MVLLMVTTVVYVPLVLPLVLPGVAVDPLAIARSLVVTMLIPLTIGLLVSIRYSAVSNALRLTLNQASNTGLILLLVLVVVLNLENIVGVIGTGAILALVSFVILVAGFGYVLGGPKRETRVVSALGAGQRNVAAALVVAAQNFADPDVLVMLVVGAVVMLGLLMPLAGEIGRRDVKDEHAMSTSLRATSKSSTRRTKMDDE